MIEPNLGTPFLDVGQERARSRKPTALKSVLRLWSRFRAIDPAARFSLTAKGRGFWDGQGC